MKRTHTIRDKNELLMMGICSHCGVVKLRKFQGILRCPMACEKILARNRRIPTQKMLCLSVEEIKKLKEKYNYCCAICGLSMKNLTGRDGPHIDHDHLTKKIRGILCQNCNRGLGMFKERREILLAAIQYLEKTHG